MSVKTLPQEALRQRCESLIRPHGSLVPQHLTLAMDDIVGDAVLRGCSTRRGKGE